MEDKTCSIYQCDIFNMQYVEYVPEVAQHPDYDKAIKALKSMGASWQIRPIV